MNGNARLLQAIGAIDMILGIVIVLFYALKGELGYGLAVMVGCLITGIVFFGFGEVINLLQKISDSLSRIETTVNYIEKKQ